MFEALFQAVIQRLSSELGQDVAEYAIMVAVIAILVVSAVRLLGANSTHIFSTVGSSIAQ